MQTAGSQDVPGCPRYKWATHLILGYFYLFLVQIGWGTGSIFFVRIPFLDGQLMLTQQARDDLF